MRPLALLLVLSACAAPLDAPTSVCLATWNAERVFDTTCDSLRCGPDEAEDVRTPAEMEADVTRVARGVRGLDADVVVLVEIETETLAMRIAQAVGDVESVVSGDSGPGTIDVAVLSRLPLLEARTHRPWLDVDGQDTRSTRVFLEAHLGAPGRRVIVFAAHLKSKRNDDAARRIAEAEALRDLARAASSRHPDALVFVAGDLNDEPDSETLDTLEVYLALLTRMLPESDAYTFGSGSRRSLIDHVLLLPRPFATPRETAVVRGEGASYGGSDHAAVRAVVEAR